MTNFFNRPISFLLCALAMVLLSACGSSHRYKTPLDELVKRLDKYPNFTIILYDMDADGTFFTTYKQQYKVVIEEDGVPKSEITPWAEVSQRTFHQYEDAMGMEIAAKKEGKLNKSVVPAGYSNYVGNSQYGHWVDRGGSSFWEFYGRYAFMSSMFNLMSHPIRRSYYNDYYSNYRSRGRDYYGPVNPSSGRSYYGTYADKNTRSNSKWSKSSAFKSRVQSRSSRSSSRSSKSSGWGSRSRSSSSSSYRSRGGGFGK
ncbi:hypothetical protein [Persicobacter psychrovividus]|uniref:Lipoprotein n=1 Tax=Persicobacter psychrovividus TaxID=387638 RepID=A0ABM7VDP5_9BACT|nr:hypothetical protein PEPS_13590 [Persicobacter psychrovividus]